MSAEAMIERFSEVQDSTESTSGRIEAILQHGVIFFRRTRPGSRWETAAVAVGAVVFSAMGIFLLWRQQEVRGFHGILAFAGGQRMYELMRRWFGKATSGVAAVAAWIVLFTLCDLNLVLGTLLLTGVIVINGILFIRKISRETPRSMDLFGIGMESGRIHAYNAWGPAGDTPVVDVDYFLVYRGMPPTADMLGCLYAVEDDGTALHLAEHVIDPRHQSERILRVLGYICQKPVLLLDELDQRGNGVSNHLAVVRGPKKKWRITGLSRETLFRTASIMYQPGDSIA